MPYDWSGARMRRTRLLRMTGAGMLLVLVVSVTLLTRLWAQQASDQALASFFHRGFRASSHAV